MDVLLKTPVKATAILTIVVVFVSILAGKLLWGVGFLTGSLWSIINFSLAIDILRAALLQKNKNSITFILLLKFPLLYLTLFFVFISRVFPPLSVLAAIPLVLIITGVSRLWAKQA
jgi:polyferredoxin